MNLIFYWFVSVPDQRRTPSCGISEPCHPSVPHEPEDEKSDMYKWEVSGSCSGELLLSTINKHSFCIDVSDEFLWFIFNEHENVRLKYFSSSYFKQFIDILTLFQGILENLNLKNFVVDVVTLESLVSLGVDVKFRAKIY